MGLPSVAYPLAWHSSAGGTTATYTGVSTAAGDTAVVAVSQSNSALRTYSAADDINGAWNLASEMLGASNVRYAGIFYKQNLAGGSITITVTVSAAFDFDIFYWILSGVDATSFDVASSFDQTVGDSNHPCAASGAIDTVANVFIAAVGTLNVDDRPYAAGGSYINYGESPGTLGFAQSLSSVGALTDERGIWTSAGALRVGVGAIASFKGSSGPPPAMGGRVHRIVTRPAAYRPGIAR